MLTEQKPPFTQGGLFVAKGGILWYNVFNQKEIATAAAQPRNVSEKGRYDMAKVLFVCHGNICRSPMGEFVLRDMVKKAGLAAWEIQSRAGSREELGNPVYPPARRELTRHGIACDGHRATQITLADFDYFDHIYYMDSSNLRYLNRMFPGQTKCRPLLNRDVADPWYTGDFTQTWEDIVEGCRNILEELV